MTGQIRKTKLAGVTSVENALANAVRADHTSVITPKGGSGGSHGLHLQHGHRNEAKIGERGERWGVVAETHRARQNVLVKDPLPPGRDSAAPHVKLGWCCTDHCDIGFRPVRIGFGKFNAKLNTLGSARSIGRKRVCAHALKICAGSVGRGEVSPT